MRTTKLAQAIIDLALAQTTGLLFNFQFGKLHIEGQAQSVTVSEEGNVSTGNLYNVSELIDFDKIELELIQKNLIDAINIESVITVTDDKEILFSDLFKLFCKSSALKAIKLNAKCSDAERTNYNLLNRADTFINDLLPRVLCKEPAPRSSSSSTATVLTAEQLATVGINNLSLIALDDDNRLLAVPYKHQSFGQCYKITYNYLDSSDIAVKIVAKLQQGGHYLTRMTGGDKDNRLTVYVSPERLLVDDLDI